MLFCCWCWTKMDLWKVFVWFYGFFNNHFSFISSLRIIDCCGFYRTHLVDLWVWCGVVWCGFPFRLNLNYMFVCVCVMFFYFYCIGSDWIAHTNHYAIRFSFRFVWFRINFRTSLINFMVIAYIVMHTRYYLHVDQTSKLRSSPVESNSSHIN